jgi:hypothetical protein
LSLLNKERSNPLKNIQIPKFIATVSLILPLIVGGILYFTFSKIEPINHTDTLWFTITLLILISFVLWMPLLHILFRLPDSIIKNELIRVGFYIVLMTFSIPLFWLTYNMLLSKDYLLLLTGAIALLFNQLIKILAKRNQLEFNLTHFDFGYWILCYQLLMGYVLLNLIG